MLLVLMSQQDVSDDPNNTDEPTIMDITAIMEKLERQKRLLHDALCDRKREHIFRLFPPKIEYRRS